MTKADKTKKRVKGKKKFNLISYIKKNRLNTAIAVFLVLFLSWGAWNYTQPRPGGNGVYVTAPVSAQPKHIPGKNYITSGEWTAAEFSHDTGHEGDNETWVSEKNGFGYLISCNYLYILEGVYNVSFRMKIENNTIDSKEKVVGIEVARDRGVTVVGKLLYMSDFKESSVYQDFTIRLETENPLNDAELRVHFDKSPATVTIEKVTLTPTGVGDVWRGSDPALKHDLGREDVNDSWTSGEGGFGYLISGPYVKLKPGKYEVVFTMKVDKTQIVSDVGIIGISKDRGVTIVENKLSGKDFKMNDTYQDFTLNLETGEYLNDVEFRVHYPKGTVKLTVEKIELKEET